MLATAGAAMASPALRASAQTAGVALVIGNSKYHWEAPLPNVRRDAPDMARRFQELGLKTELIQDAGRDAMTKAAEKLAAMARGASFAACYFAGHGASWNRGTFLVPVDADLASPDAVKNLLPLKIFRDATREAANKFLAFDSCRNNPADGWRQKEDEDRAAMPFAHARQKDDPVNMVLLFSTVPGRAALDGPAGQNSPFAASLLRQLAAPPVDLPGLPARVRRDLLLATGGRQLLWERNSFGPPFQIAGPRDGRPPAPVDASRAVELVNTYAYAQQNNLPIPRGLVAVRPPGGRDAGHVGAYKFQGFNQDPSALLVLSVEDPRAVELVLLTRDNRQTAKWRSLQGADSGDSIEFTNPDGRMKVTFKWSDANSGKVSMVPQGTNSNNTRMTTGAFSRLD